MTLMKPRPSLLLSLAALVALLMAAPVAQQRDPKQYQQTLENPERIAALQVDRVVGSLGIQPGMRIADLGAGTGIFTIPMARAAGKTGRLYAIDVDPGLLKIVEDKATVASLPTVRTIVAGDVDPKIPEPVDLIFICDTMHHLPNQAEYVKGLAKYLKPSGKVAVIDFSEGNWPAGHEAFRVTPSQVTEWMAAAGFTLETSHTFLATNFFHVYRLKSAAPPDHLR